MYTVIAVAVGLVVGLASGGRFVHMASRPFRSAWLLVIGLVLQGATEAFHLPHLPDVAAVLVSYAALAAFAGRNLNIGGMGLVVIGLALNILPIAINGGMPVRASAIVRAGIVKNEAQIRTLGFGGKRHLEGPGDRLTVLGDILPDWVFHEVLSFGDLVLSVGIATVLVNLLHPIGRRRDGGRGQRSGDADAAAADPGDPPHEGASGDTSGAQDSLAPYRRPGTRRGSSR